MLHCATPWDIAPPDASTGMRTVLRSTLHSGVHSCANRRRARDMVWAWVRAKWPRLLPPAGDLLRGRFERTLAGQALRVSGRDDGADWTLVLAHQERAGARTWLTQVRVADTGNADLFHLQTGCSDLPEAPPVVAPPRLLRSWVDGLQLEDAGLAVTGRERAIDCPAELVHLRRHLESDQRRLPVLLLANRRESRYYGVDPRGLAHALRGLAHVVCVGPEARAAVPALLGANAALVPGAVRLLAPGFGTGDAARRHPLLRDARGPGQADDAGHAGSFRRMLCRRVCALSVLTNARGDAVVPRA